MQRRAKKPYRLKRWRIGPASEGRYFWTCARPGRGRSAEDSVTEDEVHEWVLGIVELVPGEVKAIVSLLGRKRNGTSEFAFYPFVGGDDEGNDGGSRSFRGWLEQEYPAVLLREHPTVDYESVPDEKIAAIKDDISRLMAHGATVVIIDSGGMQRTSQVALTIGGVEDSRS